MSRERRRTRLADALEALSRAGVAEMLREMSGTLGKLAGCAYLSPAQEDHIGRAARHMNAAVAEWIGDVMDAAEVGGAEQQCSGCPDCPRRYPEHATVMLDIYEHDFGKRDFTPMQLHCLMVAVHNLGRISEEIMESARCARAVRTNPIGIAKGRTT